MAEPSGSLPGPVHAYPRRHPSAAIESSRLLLARRYLQRGRSIPSTSRGCCECTARFFVPGDLDLWLLTLTIKFIWVKDQKYVLRVNLAHVHSAVLAIHCRMRVPRKKACSQFRMISQLKLVAMATSLDRSGNQYQIEHLQGGPKTAPPWLF